jgi:hypothetical protein
MTPSYEAALDYLANGWSPVAVVSDREGKWKKPAVGGWDRFSHEHPTPEEIDEQFLSHPDARVGVVCGEASNLFVIDLDGTEGIANFKAMCPGGRPPMTVMSRTGGGGVHLFFFLPTSEAMGFEISNSVGKLGKGIDVRASRGFVVTPPSTHSSGKDYSWIVKPWWVAGRMMDGGTGKRDVGGEILAPPEWLVDRLRESCKVNDEPREWMGEGEAIPDGQRNNTLAAFAGAMRWANMSVDAIFAALSVENDLRCNPPLATAEIRAISKSVSRYKSRDDYKRSGGAIRNRRI